MSGGGGTQASSTTTTSLPGWEVPTAKNYLSSVNSQVQNSLQNYPSGINQTVAPFTSAQNAGLGLGASQTGAAQSLANTGASTLANFASGNNQNNPYLNSLYGQAANQLTQQYNLATQPALAAQFQQAGAFNSPGYNQAQGLAQSQLGNSLATLGAGIYEPAYQQGQTNQLNAALNTGTGISNLYAPSQQLYNIGATQQQQQQNVNNANTANAQQQANWPFAVLSQLGSAIGQASGGGGVTTSTGPAGASGLGGLLGK